MTKEERTKKTKKKFRIKSWYSNRYQIVLVQRNILLLLTVFSVISMAFAILFVKYMVSSKSLEPYVIEIEEKSGIATIVDQSTSRTFTGDEAMKKYFINQFLQSSTAYDPKTYKLDAEKVRLFSSPTVYKNFRQRINARKLGTESRIKIRIKTIKFVRANTVQVRIISEINKAGEEEVTKNETVTLNFNFKTKIKLTMEERLINPLGFQITSYSKTEEIFDY